MSISESNPNKPAEPAKPVLLHICCAPCATYPISVLTEEGLPFKGLFFNPNIHPIEEFARRKQTLEQYASLAGFDVRYEDDFLMDRWLEFSGAESAAGSDARERCMFCYTIRMRRAAAYASQNGFAGFTTTLLVSPYQKHDLIREAGEKAAAEHGTAFIYRDFRDGFRKGQSMAKELGLYRQKYCGCIISLGESCR